MSEINVDAPVPPASMVSPEAHREIVEKLMAKIAELRAAGARRDKGAPRVVEKVVLKKFERTPLPGEDLEPIETVVIEDGQIVSVTPGKGGGDSHAADPVR